MDVMIIILSVLVGGLLVFLGVALGGFLVFRTKRESEPLFVGKQEGFATNLEEPIFDDPEPPEVVNEANESFINQFAQGLNAKSKMPTV